MPHQAMPHWVDIDVSRTGSAAHLRQPLAAIEGLTKAGQIGCNQFAM
jgi:hypothetical protein